MINPDTTNAQVAIHEFNSEGGTQVNIDCSGNAIQSPFGPVLDLQKMNLFQYFLNHME